MLFMLLLLRALRLDTGTIQLQHCTMLHSYVTACVLTLPSTPGNLNVQCIHVSSSTTCFAVMCVDIASCSHALVLVATFLLAYA
jgi:hypothetical protein